MQKQYLLYAAGGLLVLLLTGVWGYLLIYGVPQSTDEVFATFGFTPDDDPALPTQPLPPPDAPPQPTVDVGGDDPLQQLTTRAVAGYRALTTSSSTLYYAELGTGHLYTINLTTGEETRLSGTTIPGAHDAVFSPDGRYVAMASRYHDEREVVVGSLSTTTESLDYYVLDEVLGLTVEDFTISNSPDLLFTTEDVGGVTGNTLALDTRTKRQLFILPFREATILWGGSAAAAHLAITKPARLLPGYLYQMGRTLTALPPQGFGLTALANGQFIAYTTAEAGEYRGVSLSRVSGERRESAIAFLPEKCAFDPASADTLFCGYDYDAPSETLPDAWYQGVYRANDALWRVSLSTGAAELLITPSAEVGRELDITNLTYPATVDALFFTNKVDNTLWMYAR